VHLDDHGWARGTAFLERRCELSAALGAAKSGVHWFGHGMVGFRAGARETVRGMASWSASVRGSGGVATYTGCRARSCAGRGEWSSVRAGTRTPVSASPGVLGVGRAGARARPMSVLGGRRRLVELGGGEWGLMVQWWSMASPRSFKPTGMCPSHADERGRGQGGV
jgi:hypothetical protein